MANPAVPQKEPTDGLGKDKNQTSPEGRTSSGKPGNRINRRIDQPQELAAPVQLPAFRELQKLMSAIEDEEVDFTDFCVALRDVPQVQKLIFRDARSIVAGRANRIENLKHAVAMLGLNKVRAILAQLAEPYQKDQESQKQKSDKEVARVPA